MVVRDSVLGAVPVVPVTVTLNGATPVEHVTDNTARLKEAVQPTGAVPAANVRVPVKPLIAVAVTVELPDTVARVVIAGADRLKSWTVTLTFVVLDNVLGGVPVVPVTSTLNGATPVAQLTDRRALLNDAVQPVGTVPAVNVTVPVNPLTGVTVAVEVPATVASVVTGGADNEKSRMVVRDSVLGAVPAVPVTITLNGATPVVQLTEMMATEKDAVHPAGTVPAVNVTVSANPLIGVTVTVEVPATVVRVVMAGADSEKSTTWKSIGLVVCEGSVPLVPVTTTL